MRLKELMSETVVRMDEVAEKHVRFLFQSAYYIAKGTWRWEMETEALFCSDVMFSFPDDFVGTKAIFHPDDVALLKETFLPGAIIRSLAFRIITTYGEIRTVAGENISLTKSEEELQAWQEEKVQVLIRQQEKNSLQAHLQLLKEIDDTTNRFTQSGTWYFNSATGVTWYADNVFRLHGLPPQSLNAHLHTFRPFIHPDDRDFVIEFTDRSFYPKSPLHLDYRIVVNGEERWVAYRAQWFYSSQGEAVLGGQYQDITEQKTVEREREAYKAQVNFQRQQALYDEQQLNMGHWQVNLLTRKTSYSDQYYRIFGIKPGSVAPTVASFLNFVHPDDRDDVEAAYKKSMNEQAMPDLAYRIIRADGKTRYVLQKAKLLTFESEPTLTGIIQDVTVQRMLEKKIASLQEKRLKDAWLLQQGNEVGNMIHWIMNLDDHTIEWSESFYRLMGLQKTQIPGITEKSLFSLVHPHDLNTLRRHWDEAVQKMQPATFHFRLVHRGSVLHMRAVFSHQTLHDKTYFIATAQDSTGEQVLQQQLSQRVQLAERLTENILDRVLITDADHTILLWNKACETAYNRKQADAIGQNFFDVFPHLKTEAYLQLIQRVQRGEKVMQFSQHSAMSNGYYNLYLVPLYQDEEVTGILHIINDVTKETELRNRLHERLHFIENIVQSSVERVIALDRNLNYLYWNKKAEDYYGLTRENVVGKNILEVFPGLVNDPTYRELRQALRGDAVYLPVNAEEENYSETYLVPIKDEEGEVSSVLWITHDLSREYALFREQRKAAEIINTIHVAFIELDNAFRFRFVNAMAEELTGKSFQELEGKVIWDLFPEAVGTAGYDSIVKACNEKVKTSCEYFSNVYKRWIYLSAAPLEDGVLIFQYDRQDIKEAELRLQENEALLREAEQAAHTGSYEADLVQGTFRFSDGMFRLFGEVPGALEPSQDWVHAHTHPDDVAPVKAVLEQAAIDKKPYTYTQRIYHKNGTLRLLETRGNVICDAAGNACKLIGLVQDVTEAKKAEEELKESRLFIEQVVEATPGFIIVFNLVTNKIDYVNRSGYKADEMRYHETLLIEYEQILARAHPDDREPLHHFIQLFRTAADNEIHTVEYRVVKGNEVTWYRSRGKVFKRDEQNRPTHYISIIQEISGEKEAEAEILRLKDDVAQRAEDKYRLLFNTIDEGFCAGEVIFDENNSPVDILFLEENPAAIRMIGQSIVGKTLREINPAYEAYWYQIWGEVVLTGESRRMEQYSVVDDKWFDFYIAKVGDNESRRVAIIFNDITNRKTAEESQAFLLNLSDVLSNLSDPIAIEEAIATETLTYFQADRSYYCTIEEGSAIICRDAFRSGLQSIAGTYPLSQFNLYNVVLETGRPFVANDVHTCELVDEDLLALLLEADIQSFMIVPALKGGNVVGVFTIAQNVCRVWSEREIELAAVIAERTWAYVERAKAEETLRKSEERFRSLVTATSDVFYKMNADWTVMYNLEGRELLTDTKAASRAWIDTYIPESERLKVARAIEEAIRSKQMFELEHQVFDASGKLSWVYSRAIPKLNSEGEIVEWFGAASDITLRKEAEEQLKDFALMLEQQVAERTKELQEISQTTPDRITIHDAVTTEILYTNHPDFWKELYQNSAIYQQAAEKRVIGLVHKDEEEKLHHFLQQRNHLADGNVSVVELRLKGDKWVRIRSKVFKRDENGAALQVISFTTDITERKKAEQELQKNLAILQEAEGLAQIGSWEYDIVTGHFTWSEGMYRLFGLPGGSRVSPDTYLHFALEEDRTVAKRIIKNLKKNPQSFVETLRIKRDGDVRLLKVKGAVAWDEKGLPQRVVGIDLDITELKQAEEKAAETRHWLEQTALASPDAITIYNLVEKQPVYLNNCLANWLGLTNEELLQMGIDGRLQLIHPDDRLPLLHFNEKIKAAGDNDLLSLEYRLQGSDGSLRWIRNRAKVFQRDVKGQATHLLSVLQDVTESKTSERVLKTLNTTLEKKAQELESANEEITSFAFVASHDLKEPLRKIHTFTNLLLTQEKTLSEAGRRTVEKLETSVNQLNLLVNDVLTLTKVHAENKKPVPTDLNRLVERLKLEMQDTWTGTSIEVGPLPVIMGMENQLFYLFKNLISNGIKFQAKGSVPSIRIETREEGAFQKIRVSDNGIGIHPVYHKKIFEIFRRLHSRTEYEGTGMGLAICKKIMEKHGGKITLESELGRGTTFTCWFPLTQSTPETGDPTV